MIEKLLSLSGECACGARHDIITTVARIGRGATAELCGYIDSNYSNCVVVTDTNTAVYAPCSYRRIVISGDAHADERGTGELEAALGSDADVLVACGSGSLHDIVRYVAHKRNMPFVSYPTAPSVDGFVSSVAAMTWGGQKLTFSSSAPVAIFADDDVYSEAPHRLLASGVGDILGKITALFDWRVASLAIGETVCSETYDIENEAVTKLIASIDNKTDDFAHDVMECLILSGLAMQLIGNSRPASGAEHHLSHLWEMHVINAPTAALHGEKVGVGTVNVIKAYKTADLNRLREPLKLNRVFDRGYIESAYGSLTDGVLKENLPDGTLSSSSLAKVRIGDAELAILAGYIDALPSPERVASLLEAVGAPYDLAGVGLPQSDEFAERSLAFAPYVRNRLTLLKLISASAL